MHIAVCIKQVPRPGDARVEGAQLTLRAGERDMNPFDLHAVEAAIRLAEEQGGQVTAVAVGDAGAEAALREAVAMGAAAAVRVQGADMLAQDHLNVAQSLAAALGHIDPVDLIITGRQSTVGAVGLVPIMLAELLDLPLVAGVTAFVAVSGAAGEVRRQSPRGLETVRVTLPAVLTLSREIAEPRHPTFKGQRRAETLAIEVLPAVAAAAGAEITWAAAPPRKQGVMLYGPPEETARQLVEHLQEDGLL